MPGSKFTNTKGGVTVKGQGQKLSKRKKDFEVAKDKILGHLDLTRWLEPVEGGKLFKNLDTCQKTRDKIGNIRVAANRHKAAKDNTESVPSLRELLKMKENNVNPLNYSCDFSRLTQLFQRPLQIKYYAKKLVK